MTDILEIFDTSLTLVIIVIVLMGLLFCFIGKYLDAMEENKQLHKDVKRLSEK